MMESCKIGVLIDSFGIPLEQALVKASEMGIEGIQLYAVSGQMAPENITKKRIKEIIDMVASNGMAICAVCGDLGGHGFALADENEQKQEKSKRIIDLALELGCNIVTTHIGVIPDDTTSERYGIMLEACRKLAEYASRNDAYFAIETGPETALTLKKFLDDLDDPGIAVNLDPANFVMVTGQDPVEAVYILKDHIVHTHAKDGIMLKKTYPKKVYGFFADGGIGDMRIEECFREVPLGEGDVPFEKYLLALKEIGYSGYLTIERETGEDPEGDIRLAANYLKRLI